MPTRTRPHRLWGGLAIVAGLGVILAATTTVGIATVRNQSMAPTLPSGSTLVYERWSAPARGDVVLVADRDGWADQPDAVLVKRVIGLPGDVVVCCEVGSGRILRNGAALEEPYAAHDGGSIPFRVVVPDGTVWVLGDNRDASVDSRAEAGTSRGAVAVDDVRGVVRLSW